MVIYDCGDGSQSIEWHKTWSDEKRSTLEDGDEYDRYASGDGLQMTELNFPDSFDIELFAKDNYINWFEDEE
jgi:hypothetical protein